MTATATREAPTCGAARRWSGGSAVEKIQPWHWQRLAVVYVRQSTPQQVLDHQESTRLQYGLTERAVELGWAAAQAPQGTPSPGGSPWKNHRTARGSWGKSARGR